jgi:hypothetical protein
MKHSTPTNDSISISENGKLRPAIYKIMNIVGHTYADIREHTKELCGLEGKGLVGSYLRSGLIVMPIIIFNGNFSLGTRIHYTQGTALGHISLCHGLNEAT